MDNLDRALVVAKSNLRACYGEQGIFAGKHHFDDYWVRDSCFASFGCLSIGDTSIVKKNIELFLSSMTKTGQLPLRVGKSSFGIFLGYLGIKNKTRKPIFSTDKNKYTAVDQNPLLIISAYEYYSSTQDKTFVIDNIGKLERVMRWCIGLDADNDLLIEEHEYCNWADSIKKRGKVLYSNVCYCHALLCLSKLLSIAENKEKSTYYAELYHKSKARLNEVFWSGEHYADWIDREKIYNYFSTDGNILAILWDIADKSKSRHIEEASHIFNINEIPSGCVHPYLPEKFVSPQTRLIGIGDYHNGMSWLWLGAINALAKNKIGMHKEAEELLEKIATIICNEKGVYEVYEKTGKPVKRIFYKAEFPFAWSSGLFIYAAKEILNKKRLRK